MKPDKKYYDAVKSSLKIPFEEMLVVGDSFENDLDLPKKLGMKTVLVFGKDSRSDFSVNDFGKIADIAESLMI
jgi:FMN phosphatase YigB (HAD superfamily)